METQDKIVGLMMDDGLAFAIKDALKRKSIVDDCFLAMVADYAPTHNYTLKEPVRSVLKALLDDGCVRNVVARKGNVPDLDSEVKVILHGLKTNYGYDESLTFDTLKQLLKGAGCKMPSDNLASTNNQSQTTSPSENPFWGGKRQSVGNQPQPSYGQQYTFKGSPKKRFWHLYRVGKMPSGGLKMVKDKLLRLLRETNAGLKSDIDWVVKSETAVLIHMLIFVVLFVVSLIAIVIGWIDGWGHAPVWIWLFWESLVLGGAFLFYFVSIDN